MKPRIQFILLLLFVFLIQSCNSCDPDLNSAYLVYRSNMKGIALYEELSDERKDLLKENIGNKIYRSDLQMLRYLGKPHSIWSPFKVSKEVKRSIKYSPPSIFSIKSPSYEKLIRNKDALDKTEVKYNREREPIIIDTTTLQYNNGRLTSYGNEKYDYSDIQTSITWLDDSDNEVEERYIWNAPTLHKQEFENGVPTNKESFSSYDENMQRTYAKFKTEKERYYDLRFTYNDKSQITKVIEENVRTTRNREFHNSKENRYTYYENGFIRKSQKYPLLSLLWMYNRDKYYYYFFKDKKGLLNLLKLSCNGYRGPKRGRLSHFIFDNYSNILYYHSRNLINGGTHSYFKEYEYY